MTTKTDSELTLRDRLSRLTYEQACKLLGAEGRRLIQAGGKHNVDLDADVLLGNDLFRLKLPGAGAVVTITLMAEARRRLRWNCTACENACEHAGAAFSLILEEKTALGLAAPPPETTPIESLDEQALIRLALDERRQRADSEKMRLKALEPGRPWTDYTVTNPASGKTYRVALRGPQRGESYCSCPDFRKNTLGTCKHIMHVLNKVERRFPATVRKRPFRRKNFSLHVRYDHEMTLRLRVPDKMDDQARTVVRPLVDRPIEDVHDLIKRIGRLERNGQTVTIYPDAEHVVQQRLLLDRVRRITEEVRKKPQTHPLRKKLLKVELLPYQLEGIAFAVGAGRAVLADDMGLGKTIQGIGAAELLAREAGIGRVLVICPATLKSQWLIEIERFSDRDCQLVLGGAAERARQYDNGCFFTICNYEQVLRDMLSIEQVKWDLIILDEGQRIKNWQAKTSQVIKSLKSPFALVLSGTPMENRLDELYSVVEFIDDRRLDPAFRFFNRHRVVDEKGKVLGYKNLAELRRNLQPILLRRTRDSVMKQLPPRTTQIVRIAPTDEQLELHSAHMQVVTTIIHKKFISEMDLLRLQRALLMCRMAANGTYLVNKQNPAYSSKLVELDDLIDRLFQEEGRKVVLFSEWTTMLNLIEPLLAKRKLSHVRLDGSVPQKKRQQLVHEFQNNADCKLFITTNAGATGLNLQAANTVINVDLPWNPAILEQRIARAHRMGQKQPVQVFVLVTTDTLEENLLSTLSAKHALALAALDPESDVDQVDMHSGIEELKRRLEVLLGAKPEAALDESVQRQRQAEVTRLARQKRVADAGGQLLGAAVGFLSELVPPSEPDETSKQMTGMLKQQLEQSLETGEDGRPKLTITLPDASALNTLAEALGRLLTANK